MALPKQVQAQLAEVEELEKTLTARKKGSEPEENSTPDQEPETEAAETEPETKQEAKPEEVKPADVSPKDVTDDFEQKYRTLKGKYDAEVPRLNTQVRDLRDQIESLKKDLTEKQAEPEQPKEKVSYVTDADREEFGDELIDVQRRVAREVAEEYNTRLEAQAKIIEDLRSKVAETGNQVGEMSFSQRLQQLVPDFAQIDNDQRWIAWLDEYDPIVRGPRRAVAKAAFDAGDADAVAHYVKLFKESTAETPEPAKDARKAELEKQVAPNRSANSSRNQNAGREAKTYTTRQVEDGWAKVRVLMTRGQMDDAAKLEAELTAAYLEGRVRP